MYAIRSYYDSLQATAAAAKPAQAIAPLAPEITIDDFARIDLRIARIVAAERVEGADKLLRLTLDIGSGARTVFAGIRHHAGILPGHFFHRAFCYPEAFSYNFV